MTHDLRLTETNYSTNYLFVKLQERGKYSKLGFFQLCPKFSSIVPRIVHQKLFTTQRWLSSKIEENAPDKILNSSHKRLQSAESRCR